MKPCKQVGALRALCTSVSLFPDKSRDVGAGFQEAQEAHQCLDVLAQCASVKSFEPI